MLSRIDVAAEIKKIKNSIKNRFEGFKFKITER